MSVYTKLMQARMRLHSQKIGKSGYNSFAKYAYMELSDFLIPTQTIFADIGLCGIVSFTADIASLTIIDTEDGSQHVITSPMGSAALKGCHEVQNVGAVETYQRRYLWVAAMEIVEHDALDSSEPVNPADTSKNKPKVRSGVMEAVLKDTPEPSAEDKLYFAELAAELESLFAAQGQKPAFERVTIEGLDSDQSTYLWSLLGSKIRSALKAEKGLRMGAA
jgi:hypothetical protein